MPAWPTRSPSRSRIRSSKSPRATRSRRVRALRAAVDREAGSTSRRVTDLLADWGLSGWTTEARGAIEADLLAAGLRVEPPLGDAYRSSRVHLVAGADATAPSSVATGSRASLPGSAAMWTRRDGRAVPVAAGDEDLRPLVVEMRAAEPAAPGVRHFLEGVSYEAAARELGLRPESARPAARLAQAKVRDAMRWLLALEGVPEGEMEDTLANVQRLVAG